MVREDLVLDGLTELQALPNRLWVFGNLKLANLPSLRAFARDCRVTGRQLSIERCPALEQLPPLSGDMIFIEHCQALAALPAITCDTLSINHCDRLEAVPDTIAADASLWVSDCARSTASATRFTCATCRCGICRCSNAFRHRRQRGGIRSRSCR